MTDLEGYDQRALRGLLEVLRRDRPYVLTEFNPTALGAVGEDPSAVLEEYSAWGYDIRALGTGLPLGAHPSDVVRAAKDTESGFVSLLLSPNVPRTAR